MEHAVGVACSMAAGLEANFGTMTKPLHAGQASRNGVIAVLLAKEGFTSAKGILETQHGFAEVIGRRLDHAYLKRSLGNPWAVMEPGIHLKAYPSCMVTHAGLDAVLEIARKVRLSVNTELPGKGVLATLVSVTMDAGRRYEKLVEYPRGSKNNPMIVDEVAEKFRGCAGAVLPKEEADELVKLTLQLESLDSVSSLTRLLRVRSRRGHRT